MKNPTIPEVEPQFEQEVISQIDPFQQPFQQPFQAQVVRCETLTLSARRRSSKFEETLTPDSSVVDSIFDVPESQVQLSKEDEGYCGRRQKKVRDIALGKSKGYVFATMDEMNIWMDDEENVAKLEIGDNLYIVYKQIMDYWWDDTGLRAIKTELPEMSNVITILGTATGRDNAIIELLFSGNTLELAINSSFITNNYDETRTDQRTFNTIIHSVGIMVQNYDNNSVVCAGGDVKAIQDINASNQYDALMLLNADMSQLIDVYTKHETNNLLNNKADSGVSCSKGEEDALLLLMADKTQLIDSNTKCEADNLHFNKANQSTNQTKTETGQLLSLIDDDDVDLTNYYSKTKTDELLDKIRAMTYLSNYMTLSTDNNVVILGTGGIKTISELSGSTTDLSNYYCKSENYSRTKTDNKYLRLEGSIKLSMTKKLKYVSLFGETYDETSDPVANTYLTLFEVDAKLFTKMDSSTIVNLINSIQDQKVNGSKIFTSNVNATGFVKTGKDDTSVLLAGGGDQLISQFGVIEDLTSSAFFVKNDVAVMICIPILNHTVYKGVSQLCHDVSDPILHDSSQNEY
ncbi:MAG: hypothetical protein EZS28_020002 [Streblomastix strix]|uniref:Uncharacterized protein n=1 Tax=Streblomastix strix TaxID=222440 RepID=A0A5J4VPQ2_9EUKA|nr:MAG: hypothetical protein EZS28_020002 [Streblomastix strix]